MSDPSHIADEIEVCVEKIVYSGRGLARRNGQAVFVAGVLPGEVVRARVTRTTHRFLEAYPTQLVTPSPLRIPAACPLALAPDPLGRFPTGTYCPGCCYRHMSYPAELEAKAGQFAEFLTHHLHLPATACCPPVASPLDDHYRNKIVLHAKRDAARSLLGYFGPDNTTILDVTTCPLALDAINARLAELRASPGFMNSLHTHAAVTLRQAGPEVMHWIGRQAPNCSVREETAAGPMVLPIDSFRQVNTPVARILADRFVAGMEHVPHDSVVDLYGGVGVFGLLAARHGARRVTIIDSDAPAVAAAQRHAEETGLSGFAVRAGTAERLLAEVLGAASADRTLLVVDPPRRGLSERVVKTVLKYRPASIACISCAPDTLTRDLRLLQAGGYVVSATGLLDMFPRTTYFESLTWLRWAGAGSNP